LKNAVKRISKIALTLIFILALLLGTVYQLMPPTSGNERYFSGAAEEYCNSLIELGFPSDYAIALTELHMLHPNWSFRPLDVTGLKSTYTWEYVIEQETKHPETNLVSASSAYSAYHHPLNHEKYDSGYYQASVEAVEYFMDPRNFLNEADIFLFFDLAAGSDTSMEAIEAVLSDTFMEKELLDNGMSYAAYFQKIGTQLGISPVYLAAKARQEQGVKGSSPLISGACGTKLWEFYRDQKQYSDSGGQIIPPSSGYTESELKALDGFYNFYNVKASGTGIFKIYYNAMLRAKEGTESQKSDWGGDPSWNTEWKSIFGGAYMLKESYVDRYQSTAYLQKFNVDGRSGRNFWGQYMQNVAGALIEARSLYQSIASVGALDAPATFLIPVYRDMPHHASSDPAGGECSYLRSTDQKYGYGIALRNPISAQSDDTPLYRTVTVVKGETVKINGLLSHDYGVRTIEYSLDGGVWVRVDSDAGRFDFEISSAFLQSESHILIIRGIADFDADNAEKKSNSHFLGAVLYLNVNENAA
jgi:beta-N-acetylglucosaminidase